MDNHFHLLVQTAEPTISTGMCYLNSLYARRFNNRHGLRGHLFERRFHSEVVKTDEHLRELVRYLALNPVRSRPVPSPQRIGDGRAIARWSASTRLPDFLNADLLRAQFSSVAELERFVLDGLEAAAFAHPLALSTSAATGGTHPPVGARHSARHGARHAPVARRPRARPGPTRG